MDEKLKNDINSMAESSINLWDRQFSFDGKELESGVVLKEKDGNLSTGYGNQIKAKISQRVYQKKAQKEGYKRELARIKKEKEFELRQELENNSDQTYDEYLSNHPRQAEKYRKQGAKLVNHIKQIIVIGTVFFAGILFLWYVSSLTSKQEHTTNNNVVSQSSADIKGDSQDSDEAEKSFVINDATKTLKDSDTNESASESKQESEKTQKESTSEYSSGESSSIPDNDNAKIFNVSGNAQQLSQPMANGDSLDYSATYHFQSASAAAMWANAQSEFWKSQGYTKQKLTSSSRGGVNLTFEK